MSAVTLPRPERTRTAHHPVRGRRIAGGTHRTRRTAYLTALAFAVVAAVLRLVNVTTSYDLFIDEATYAAIARDTTLAAGPLLHGLPFVLHPPLALLFFAGPANLLGTNDVLALVTGLRPFVAVVGALTVAVLYLTLHRAGMRRSAFFAAALVALDPFIISFDSRVMLEALAQLFAVLTIAAAIRAATAVGASLWRWTALTAVAGALTFGTKETFGLVVLATLVLIVLTSPRGSRRPPLVAVAGTLAGYGMVNVAMIAWAGFDLWWHMRTDGLFRLLGTRQTTGFKAEGSHGSFWDRLVPNIAELGATYAILAIGGGCAVLLLWGVLRHRPAITALSPDSAAAAKIIALWAVCACGYVGYAVAFGSLEEQMFYIAAAPCAAALTIGVFLIRRRGLRRTAAAGIIVVMAVQATAWVLVHTSTDDVYAQMLERMPTVAAEGSTMSVTEETGQFVITGYDLGQWVTVPELRENEVDYVLLSDRLVENGYGIADREFAAEVRDNGSLVLSVEGRESDLQLYDVREWTGAADPDSPTTEDAS